MHYVGIDIAVEKHDVCLMDEDGRVLTEFTISNDCEGYEKLRQALEGLEGPVLNVERPNGLLVEWLALQSYCVFVTPPLLVAHRRGRRSKDDRGDAYLLAQLLRMKDPDCRPLARQSSIVQHLVRLVKAYEDVLQEQRREEVRLIWTLRHYYPAANKAFRRKDSKTFLAFLEAYPTANAARKLSREDLESFLRKQRSYTGARVAKLYDTFQTPSPPVAMEQGYAEEVLMLVPRLRLLNSAASAVRPAHRRGLQHTPGSRLVAQPARCQRPADPGASAGCDWG